jgi:nucleoside-diphosphate-sugar epimerase
MKKKENKKVLVTGGTGFVGGHLVDALVKKGYEVTCLVREKSDQRLLKDLNVRLTFGDVTKKDSLTEAVKDVDYIYHLAGVTRADSKKTYETINFFGTKNLIEICEKVNPQIKKFLYMSSLAAAGPSQNRIPVKEDDICHPLSDYGKSKLKGEGALKRYNKKIPITIVRPCAVYGPGEKDILNFFKCIKMGFMPLLGGKKRYVVLGHVKDIVNGTILAAESKYSFETFFLAGDSIHTWEEIGEIISKVLGKKSKQFTIPYALLNLGAYISELFLGLFKIGPTFNRQKLREIRQDWICDIKKAKKLLGYTPTVTLEDGMKEAASWYSVNGWL